MRQPVRLQSLRQLISMQGGVVSVLDCVWPVVEATHRLALLHVSPGVEPCAVCLRKLPCVAWESGRQGEEVGLWGEMTIATIAVIGSISKFDSKAWQQVYPPPDKLSRP